MAAYSELIQRIPNAVPSAHYRYAQGNVKEKAASGHVTAGYWGCVSGLEGALILQETSPNFDGEEYVEILEDQFLPAVRALRPGEVVTLVQDNAPWHTALVVQDFLRRQNDVQVSAEHIEISRLSVNSHQLITNLPFC